MGFKGLGFASAAGALFKSAEIVSPRGRPHKAIPLSILFYLFPASSGLFGPCLAFWASSQPFLGLGPLLGLLWASGPLPAFSGLGASSGPFLGFWASPSLFWPRGLFCTFCGFLSLFPAFSGLGLPFPAFCLFWA